MTGPTARRASFVVVILAMFATSASIADEAVPGSPTAPAPQACRAVFCAGASTADITPPVTSPQFAYTFRHCAVSDPVDAAAHVGGVEGAPFVYPDHVEEGIAWALGGGTQCASNKLAPDTDGYAKTFPPSEGTYGRLQANAFVLRDAAGTSVAIVQVDLGGLPGEVHEAVAKRIVSKTGIGREHLLISATHTHGSVGGIFQYQGYALLGGDEYDPRIYEAVVAGITRSVLEAHARLRPAKLAVGEGEILDANHNRRSGAWALNPEAQDADGDGVVPPRDAPRLLVIRVDTTDGIPLGVITNYANHGVIHGTFNWYLSGDNQGAATRSVARGIRTEAEEAGIDFPKGWEVVDALTNGAAGDISPDCDRGGFSYSQYGRFEIPFEEFACMENAGARQTPEALRVWRDLAPSLSADVTLDARFDWVCFCGQQVPDDIYDDYDRDPWVPANDDPDYFGTSIEAILGGDDEQPLPFTVFPAHHKEKPRLIGSQTNPSITRIQLLRIGRLALASMPGEPTIQMGRRIERSVQAALGDLVDRVVTVGLANDYDSYMATIQEYEKYAYEGGFSLFGQQTGNLLKARLVQLAGWMRARAAVPECTRERGCIEHPDTTFLAADPQPLTPDVRAGEPLAQPSSVQRFVGTRFSWLGGGPGAEWSPDDPLVEVQRRAGKKWVTVASDLDTEVPVHYDKWAGVHRWDAYFDPPKDQPAGTYRFRVTGHFGGGPGIRSPYELVSGSFTVSPSTALAIAKAGSAYQAQNPAPDPNLNYRYRTLVAATATVTGTLTHAGGGSETVTLPATFTLASGDTLSVAPGGVVDAWGNTNAQALMSTG